jgi:DNA-binding MarR family transcriptional regulator
MKTARTRIGIRRGHLPLRVVCLLGGGVQVDGDAAALYSEAMNKIPGRSTRQDAGPSQTRGTASLFGFLDVAEQLYERIAQALETVGLSYAKYELLRNLVEAGDAVPLGVLAEGQGCARSNITQLMDRLEADGLVRRVNDPDDRRSVRAELTSLGSAKAQEGSEQIDNVRAEFAATFTSVESRELGRLLDKIL